MYYLEVCHFISLIWGFSRYFTVTDLIVVKECIFFGFDTLKFTVFFFLLFSRWPLVLLVLGFGLSVSC